MLVNRLPNVKEVFFLLLMLLVSSTAEGACLIVDFEAVPDEYYLDGDWIQATGNLDGFYEGLWFGRYAGIYVTGMTNYNHDVYPPHSGEKVLASEQQTFGPTAVGVQFEGGPTNYVKLWYSWTKSQLPGGPQTLFIAARDSTYDNILYSEAITDEVVYGNDYFEVYLGEEPEDFNISFVTVTGPPTRFILDDLEFNTPLGPHGYPETYAGVPILAVFAEEFGQMDCVGGCLGDLDGDDDVDGSDLASYGLAFESDCP